MEVYLNDYGRYSHVLLDISFFEDFEKMMNAYEKLLNFEVKRNLDDQLRGYEGYLSHYYYGKYSIVYQKSNLYLFF